MDLSSRTLSDIDCDCQVQDQVVYWHQQLRVHISEYENDEDTAATEEEEEKKRPFHFDSAIDSIEWRNPFLVRPGPSASSLSLASDTFRNQKGLLNSGEPHAVCS